MHLKLTILPFLVALSLESVVGAPKDVSFIVIDRSTSETQHIREKRDTAENKNDVPIIQEMNINSNISNRFVKTLIESKVKNAETTAKEATFSVVLPEKAFISEFVMEIGGKSYKAYVKEKEEAKNIYNKAVSSGQSAAHVAVSARHSNRFTVSINIEAESKAAFLLTYEELLERRNNQYELVLNIHPGQIVKDLHIQVNINETRPLVFVKTPSLRSGNEINKNGDKIDPSSSIEIINQTSAVINFHPDADKQKEFAKQLGGKESEGLAGQFIVQYDVERDPHGGEVLLKDGYFVHFFAPKDVQPLAKNVFFILDTSSSMWGIKIKQLKNAMDSILGEIKPEDSLSIVEFNSDTLVWNIESKTPVKIDYSDYKNPFPELSKREMPGPVTATKEIIDKAKQVVSNLQATGSTYMIGGLEAGLQLVKSQIQRTAAGSDDKKQSIIIFLTDGEPNVGMYSTEEITQTVTRLNKENEINVPIFSLSFGDGADKAFLRKLSLKNMGFARHIYEAADASLQLEEFYKQISSPLLSNVDFKYDSEVKDVTKRHYPILFDGSEIVVAGRYQYKGFESTVRAYGHRGPVILHPKIEAPVSSLERLWAYLTVKETLDEREAADNKTELTKKALDLALKYSFVTDVSSLVVVKPNDTNAVDTEDASKPHRPVWSQSSLHSAAGPTYYSSMARSSAARPLYSQHKSFAVHRYYDSDPTSQLLAISPRMGMHMTSTSPIIVQTTEKSLEDSLDWLSSALNANRTLTLSNGVYELGGLSLNVPAGDQCPKTPKGQEGHCTLIKDCPEIFSLLTDFDVYKQYFCPVQNKYAGVCCPKKTTN